jgi:aldehyde:ferredoxin oxidoreductase
MSEAAKIHGALAGKILRVDLSTGAITTEDSLGYAVRTLGGRGTNSLILINEIEVGTTWDDPANLLCFGAGSLVGTVAPGACRTDISTINVFTGGKGSANVGGSWGAELKYAGFDHIIVRGKAKRPVYISINDDHVEIRDASKLWGKTTSEAEDWLRRELRDEGIEIAAIGPAGENRVRGSAIMIDTAKAAGGSGVGCVMGDKKLKAVVVRGHGKIEVFDRRGFLDAVAKTYRQCEANQGPVATMRRSAVARFEDLDFEGWDTCMVLVMSDRVHALHGEGPRQVPGNERRGVLDQRRDVRFPLRHLRSGDRRIILASGQ